VYDSKDSSREVGRKRSIIRLENANELLTVESCR
jgi:hypothetical protein